MPVSYEFDESILVLRMVEHYLPADIRAALAAALQADARPALTGMLFDVSASTSLGARSTRDVRSMAALLSHLAPQFGGRLALLATTDLQYGQMRLGSVDVEAAGVEVWPFRDRSEALRWLRRDLPDRAR